MFAEWPPPGHAERFDRYANFKKLFKSGVNEVLSKRIDYRLDRCTNKALAETCAIVLDYPRLMSLVCANLLVGEPPLIFFSDNSHNEAWQHIANESDLWPTLLEAAVSTSYHGDGVLMARRRDDGEVVVEAKPAYTWFPELSADQCREVRKHVFAWELDAGGRKVLRVDEYLGGECRRTVYEKPKALRVGAQITGRKAEEIIGGPEIVSTGLSVPPIVHLPNLRSPDEYFGESDYTPGLLTLFGAACNRISQIDLILDLHAEPKMAGPDITDPNGDVNPMAVQYYTIEGGGADFHPRYITWDAKLDSAYKHLEKICEEILAQSEISRVLIGWVNGARYDSAQAFKLQFVPTLAKTARKRTYADPALKRVARMAVALKLGKPLKEIPFPLIQWQDGLPQDALQSAQVEQIRLLSGTTSVMSAIQRQDSCTEAAAQEEMDQIALEKAKLAPPTGAENLGQKAEESEALTDG